VAVRIIEAEEHGAIPIRVTASTKLRRDIVKAGFVQRRTDTDQWSKEDRTYATPESALFAGSVVGLLPLTEDEAVMVRPRFPAQLTQMVTAVGAPTHVLELAKRSYDTTGGTDAELWMLERIAADFLEAVESVVAQGLLREYVQEQTSTSSPKGRILFGPTIRLHGRALDYLAEISYFSRTEFTAPNQALVEALHWVTTWVDRADGPTPHMQQCRDRAVRLLHTFRFVPRDRRGAFHLDPRVLRPERLPEARSAYKRALPLGLALLARRGFSLDTADGDLALSSLLVKTDDVFEEYVRLRLAEYMPDRRLSVVDGNTMAKRYLFERAQAKDVPEGAKVLPVGSNNIEPDVLIEEGGRTRLVIDVKYKRISRHADRESVIQQLVTFAHRLGCARAVSIHPVQEGAPSGLFVSGVVGRTTIYSYRLNLGADDLEAEMRQLAKAMCELAGGTEHGAPGSSPGESSLEAALSGAWWGYRDRSEVAESQRRKTLREITAELSSGHALSGRVMRVEAFHVLTDSVVVLLDDDTFALVHPTWSGRPERPPYPAATPLGDAEGTARAVAALGAQE
jgi:5-methylcytosine-specific restriction enzyme subunit McrC